ncbi:MAG: hypothetical protein WCI75_09015 [candidate division NC10 bacterium]
MNSRRVSCTPPVGVKGNKGQLDLPWMGVGRTPVTSGADGATSLITR